MKRYTPALEATVFEPESYPYVADFKVGEVNGKLETCEVISYQTVKVVTTVIFGEPITSILN